MGVGADLEGEGPLHIFVRRYSHSDRVMASGWGDSNSRPLAPKASALPTVLHPGGRVRVAVGGTRSRSYHTPVDTFFSSTTGPPNRLRRSESLMRAMRTSMGSATIVMSWVEG